MLMVKINKHPSPRDLRWFCGLYLPAFSGLAALALYRLQHAPRAAAAALCAGALLGAIGLLFPRAGRLLYLLLVYLGLPFGLCFTYLFVITAFCCLITPMGLLMRLFGYDPLGLRARHRRAESNWIARSPSPPRSRYFDLY